MAGTSFNLNELMRKFYTLAGSSHPTGWPARVRRQHNLVARHLDVRTRCKQQRKPLRIVQLHRLRPKIAHHPHLPALHHQPLLLFIEHHLRLPRLAIIQRSETPPQTNQPAIPLQHLRMSLLMHLVPLQLRPLETSPPSPDRESSSGFHPNAANSPRPSLRHRPRHLRILMVREVLKRRRRRKLLPLKDHRNKRRRQHNPRRHLRAIHPDDLLHPISNRPIPHLIMVLDEPQKSMRRKILHRPPMRSLRDTANTSRHTQTSSSAPSPASPSTQSRRNSPSLILRYAAP